MNRLMEMKRRKREIKWKGVFNLQIFSEKGQTGINMIFNQVEYKIALISHRTCDISHE